MFNVYVRHAADMNPTLVGRFDRAGYEHLCDLIRYCGAQFDHDENTHYDFAESFIVRPGACGVELVFGGE